MKTLNQFISESIDIHCHRIEKAIKTGDEFHIKGVLKHTPLSAIKGLIKHNMGITGAEAPAVEHLRKELADRALEANVQAEAVEVNEDDRHDGSVASQKLYALHDHANDAGWHSVPAGKGTIRIKKHPDSHVEHTVVMNPDGQGSSYYRVHSRYNHPKHWWKHKEMPKTFYGSSSIDGAMHHIKANDESLQVHDKRRKKLKEEFISELSQDTLKSYLKKSAHHLWSVNNRIATGKKRNSFQVKNDNRIIKARTTGLKKLETKLK